MEGKKIDDGGAAFPRSLHPEHGYGAAETVAVGISALDYFAGQALQGLLAHDKGIGFADGALWSYMHADAMIAERNKRK